MRARFGYCFATPPGSEYPPIATEHRLDGRPAGAHRRAGRAIEVSPVLQQHGDIPSLGFRFGSFAYSADIKRPADESRAARRARCLDRRRAAHPPHPSHFNLDEALAWIARIKPKRAILTNLHTDMDYEALRGIARRTSSPASTA